MNSTINSQLLMQNVTKKFIQANSSVLVLDNVTVAFEQGKSYAITGASGSGKSTLIHLLAGLDFPTEGHINFNNEAIDNLSTTHYEQFLRNTVGLMFQSPYLIKELSVIENVMVPMLINESEIEKSKMYAEHLLNQVRLIEKKNEKPSSLSGGQQQRVALARALANKPLFLLADEPTGNLDPDTGAHILDMLTRLQQLEGVGMVISTHDEYVAGKMEYVYRIEDSKLIIK